MKNEKKLFLTFGIALLALILQFILKQDLYAQILITVSGIFVSSTMFVGMVKTIRSGNYGVDILAITAIIATLAVGEYWASLIILIMLTGGDALEDYAAKKARSELKALLDNSPQIAHKSEGNKLTDIKVEDVKINDILVVKPGEVVPVDGSILAGQSLFDEASLTGESKPVNKEVGDKLMSGTINGDGSITMTVEKLASAKSIAFDKTGTLTNGILAVDTIHSTATFSKEELAILAASVEQQSSHILAKSLVEHVGTEHLLPVTASKETIGNGIQGEVNGKIVKVGKYAFVAPNKEILPLNQTALFIAIDNNYVGYVTFTDTVRPEAKQTISQLKKQGLEHVMMVTGDNNDIASTIANQVGIVDIKSDCLPEDKINVLKNITEDARPVIMVGDGVNDAPSLAVSDIGIAMGAHGSTAASESADVVILTDDLSKVSTSIQISKDTMWIAKQSVLIGIIICILLMLIASTGVIPALLGAALQEVVDVVSIFSSLRARKSKEVIHLK